MLGRFPCCFGGAFVALERISTEFALVELPGFLSEGSAQLAKLVFERGDSRLRGSDLRGGFAGIVSPRLRVVFRKIRTRRQEIALKTESKPGVLIDFVFQTLDRLARNISRPRLFRLRVTRERGVQL